MSGSRDQSLRVWNMHTGECVSIMEKLYLNLQGMDLSKAKLDAELKSILPANGVIV